MSDWGGYFCVLLLSLPIEYPIPKQVKPKLNTAISPKISIGSALLSPDSLAGFYVSKIHCNRRVTVPPERANRLPSWYSQINTTIIRQEVQFNFSLYDILTTKKKRASRSRMYGENPFLTVNNKLFFNSCQSLILNFSEYRHWHF